LITGIKKQSRLAPPRRKLARTVSTNSYIMYGNQGCGSGSGTVFKICVDSDPRGKKKKKMNKKSAYFNNCNVKNSKN
jgi:hypothetical protein